MNRSNPAEDFSQIKKQLRELDRQIPVPFAATAKGMKDRLTSPAAAKPFLSHKLAWSAASLLLVAFIGYVLWSPLSSLVATNDSSASNGVQIEAAQETFDTNGISPYALPEDDKAGAQSTASSALRGTSDGNVSNFSEKNSIYYPAENYGQIQLALSTIPSSDSSQSARPQSSDSGFLPGADYSTSMADQVHQYTLTCTPEGAARLEIRRVSDGTLLSCTDLDCIRGTLFVEDQTLLLAGECPEGTQLQLFDISDPSSPVLQRTLIQKGDYLGAWKAGEALLVSSLYHVENTVDFIPAIYDSSNDQTKLLEAEQILLSDNCSSASFAVVTSVPISEDTEYASFAVLGGNSVTFSSGELTVFTAGNESGFSIQQEQLQQNEERAD